MSAAGGGRPPNVLVIMSDEHDPAVMGNSGHPLVQTPHLDRLAAAGTVFDSAYCNSPICVPSRMAFLTGNYCHRIGVWDLGSPLRAEIPTFGHYFTAAGYDTVLCGRTHMPGDDRLHGFGTRLFDDMHSWRSRTAPRRTPEARRGSNSHVTECGPGRGAWYDYDTTVADLSTRFLKSQGGAPRRRAPVAAVQRADVPALPAYLSARVLPALRPGDGGARRPARGDAGGASTRSSATCATTSATKRSCRSPYSVWRWPATTAWSRWWTTWSAPCLQVIDNSPLRDNTVVLYVSDHGEMAGQHGIWQKQCFYEASVRTPMILRTPGGDGGQADRRQRVAGRRAAHPARPGRHRDPIRPSRRQPGAPAAGRGRRRPGGVQRVPCPGHAAGRVHDQAGRLEVQLLRRPPAAALRPERRSGRVPRPCRRPTLRLGTSGSLHRELLNIANPEQVSERALRDQERRLRA